MTHLTPLSFNEQLEKMEKAMKMANEASESKELVSRLGASVLYSGLVDFLSIQSARLVEQIILKGELEKGNIPFLPTEDNYFYKRKVSTRTILKEIKKQLPFQASNENDIDSNKDANRINELARAMVDQGLEFLSYRDPIVHQIGNPARTFEELETLIDKAISAYHVFRGAHKEFMEAAGPYRFSEKEKFIFYGVLGNLRNKNPL